MLFDTVDQWMKYIHNVFVWYYFFIPVNKYESWINRYYASRIIIHMTLYDTELNDVINFN